MNKLERYHILLRDSSPLSTLSGAALLIIASDRLAHAITVVGALVWVYCLTSLAVYGGARFFPGRGKTVLIAFLASFITGLYLLLFWLLSPLCVLESFFVLALIPMFCMLSDIMKRIESRSLSDILKSSSAEALSQGILIIIFAFIREPLGFSTLSLPGGAQGIIVLFASGTENFLPIHLMVSASGAMLLLGYCLGFFRYLKAYHAPKEEKK